MSFTVVNCECKCKCFGDCYQEDFQGDDICGDCECHNEDAAKEDAWSSERELYESEKWGT